MQYIGVYLIGLFLATYGCFTFSREEVESLISPYASGTEVRKSVENYNEVYVPTSLPASNGAFDKKRVDGRVTRFAYETPLGTTTLEVQKSYLAAFEEGRAKILLRCSELECKRGFVKRLANNTTRNGIYSFLDFRNLKKFYFISVDFPGVAGTPTAIVVIAPDRSNKKGAKIVVETIEPMVFTAGLVDVNSGYEAPVQEDYSLRKATKPDVAGAVDHPLISRFPGAYIARQRSIDYTEYGLAVGVNGSGNTPDVNRIGGGAVITKYMVPADFSLLQIYRNYERALIDAGFDTLFRCNNKQCVKGYVKRLIHGESYKDAIDIDIYNVDRYPFKLLTAKLLRDKKPPVYFSLLISKKSTRKEAEVSVSIVEMKEMAEDLLVVDLNYLTESLRSYGKVALYGIYFDVNKAIVKPDSSNQLGLIATFLKRYPSAEFYVVGHTDNSGEYAFNLNLARERAKAVVDALHSKYGVTAGRLMPVGVGSVAPVRSNTTENSRQFNRRVELVLKSTLDI